MHKTPSPQTKASAPASVDRPESTTPPAWPSRHRLRCLAMAIAFAGGLVAALFAGTWMLHGSVAAIRCGVSLVMPVALVWLGLVAAAGWHLASRRLLLASVFFLTFLGWGFIGGSKMLRWSSQAVESPLLSDPDPAFENRFSPDHFDSIVVLGGATHEPVPGFSEVGGDGERIVSAAQAWHAGIVQTFVVTGSSTHGDEQSSSQSRQLLESLGVPADRITEIEGVNTAAEMKSLRRWMDDQLAAGRAPVVGLLTSAFHMPRAMRLATAEGLSLEPLPCAFRGKEARGPWSPADLVPDAERLGKLGQMLKEMLAKLAGV